MQANKSELKKGERGVYVTSGAALRSFRAVPTAKRRAERLTRNGNPGKIPINSINFQHIWKIFAFCLRLPGLWMNIQSSLCDLDG
jgi:hypothetical protein